MSGASPAHSMVMHHSSFIRMSDASPACNALCIIMIRVFLLLLQQELPHLNFQCSATVLVLTTICIIVSWASMNLNNYYLLIYGGLELFPASATLNSGSDALVSEPPDIEETIYGYYHKRIIVHQSVEGHREASKSCITYLKG